MKQPFKLATENISTDTVIALEELLRQAKAARLIGLTFAAMYRQRRYTINATGEARRSPTFSRGMVAALNDYLRDLVHKP